MVVGPPPRPGGSPSRRVTSGSATRKGQYMARSGQLAMLFPGQGSQTDDMRGQVERHRPDLLELARSEVSDDLFERAGDGTRWAQPAIFCAALAGYEVLKDRHEADLMAGHSLGEISALVAAGALDAEDGLRLVAARGRLMQEAAEETGDGGMLAVRSRERATVEEVAADTGLSIANDNAPDQLVQATTHPVRWTDVMSGLRDLGALRYVETGPGRVLTGLVRKSLDGVEAEAPLAREAARA